MVLLAAAAGLFLAGCDNGPSAVSQKQAAGTQMATNSQSFTSDAGRGGDEADAPQVDRRNDAVRLVDGKPMWSASRRYSAEENAERALARTAWASSSRRPTISWPIRPGAPSPTPAATATG
jgi:hypothetical protein